MSTTTQLESCWVQAGAHRMHARRSVPSPSHDGPPLVLVHGVAVSSRNMVPTAEAFAAHLPVFSPDLPGHGRSDDADHVLATHELADALVDWMEASGLERACLLGNSFGCQVAAEVAARHPRRVERLVLQGPTTDPHARGYARQVVRWIANGRLESATQSEVTLEDWRDAGLAVLVGTFRHCVQHRIEDVLPRIDVPTLVVRGENDPIVPQRWAEEATALLGDGRLVVMPDVSHTITNTRPDDLRDIALPFLRGGEPGHGRH